MTVGIYEILNTKNNKRYIGSSINIETRLSQHKSSLKHNRHSNTYLQRSWNKNNGESFVFKPLIVCSEPDLLFYEDLIITGYKANERSFGYNLRLVAASNAGMPSSKYSFEKGQTYNKLTLIQPSTRKNKKLYWVCQCICGNQIDINPRDARSGHTTSCGCTNLNNLKERNLEIAGNKYGRLTFVKNLYTNHRRKRVGLFIYDCGKERELVITEVRTGHVLSCGCLRSERRVAWLKEQHKKTLIERVK